MFYPAAVRAAAAAVWLLAVLGLGLSLPAELNSESGFSLCSDCFYRQTPPQGASGGPLLRPLCHKLPGGQAFATLSKPTCDTAVYSAFHLSHGWAEREDEEGEEPLMEGEEDPIKLRVPALLRRRRDPSNLVSQTDSPLQQWDSVVTGLVKSNISPQCSTLGGNIYILLGTGRLGETEDENESQTSLLWSAVCCAHPEGKGGFSLGLIRETEETERRVSLKELEKMLGVAQLFFEGCGVEGEAAIKEVLHGEGFSTDNDADNIGSDETITKRGDGHKQKADVDAHSEKDSQVSQEAMNDAATSPDISHLQDDDQETVVDAETDSDSTNVLIFILSTTVSILTAPLQPIISTVTNLPGQMTYILQEDLGVLAALPGNIFEVLCLLISDHLSYIGSAGEILLDIIDGCFSSVYYCASSMLDVLLSSFVAGFTGVGTLAGDTVGIFEDILQNTWSVTKFFGELFYEQSIEFAGTVMSEMGSQAQAVGGGFGRLVWRSGNGVGNVCRFGGDLITGIVDVVIGDVKEAFEQESG